MRPQKGLYRLEWIDDDPGVEFHPSVSEMFALLRENGFELLDFRELFAPEDAGDHEYYDDHLRPSGRSAGRTRRSGDARKRA